MKRTPTLLACSTLLASFAVAQANPATARATGVFCSCPPTNANSSSFQAAIAAKPFVDGFLVRIAWSDLEPSPGGYDWSLLDHQIQLCQQAGKQIALGVVQGRGTPTWLPQLGAAMIQYVFGGQQQTIALPWDTVYLQRWQSFLAALGTRYANETTISLLHVTHATHNGFEMQLPPGEQQLYLNAGYTDTLYAQSWATVVDSFAAAFPNHALDCDVHPIFGSDVVAQQVILHGIAAAPGRFGAFGGWWSVNNAQNVYPGMQAIFEERAADTFTAVQNVGSWVTTPTRYNSDLATYEAAYQLALDSGIRYVEVWNADLLDPNLDTLLSQFRNAVHCTSWYQHYPDAANPGNLRHSITGCITPGGTFALTVAGGPAGGIAVIGLGTERGNASVPGIGDLSIAPIPQLVLFDWILLDNHGDGSLTVNAPATASFRFTTQAAVLDGFGIALSNALELR